MKKIFSLFLALILVLSLAACNGETEVTEKPTQSDEAPTQTNT